jgi:succinate dehydrogenase/fumarate reductase flavoprotein subunit
MNHSVCDVAIIGSGAAGLRAAIAAKEQGLDVWVISKQSPGKGTCTYISGGVFAGAEASSSPEDHLDKALRAGRGLNQLELVKILVEEGPLRLQEMIQWGLKGRLYNGHLYSGGRAPIWGSEIVHCLLKRAKSLEVFFKTDSIVAKVNVEQGYGSLFLYSKESNKWMTISAKAIVLATGGAAALFLRHDNPKQIVGEGYRLAFDAGAVLQDMEFVQFYPLGLAQPGRLPLLIPPQLADIGWLYNSDNEDIHDKYGIFERPAGLLARDFFNDTATTEIYTNGNKVWLDLRGVSETDWHADPFSASTSIILGKKYGAKYRPVPIAPLAHHVMGGVRIDSLGATSVSGLFAAGEATGGLHGANRLGGNALTETLVFGARAGKAAAKWATNNTTDSSKALMRASDDAVQQYQRNNAASLQKQFMKQLQKALWEKAGIIRNRQGITQTIKEVKAIQAEACGQPIGNNPNEVKRSLELQSAIGVSLLILQSALKREESRGAHFREDFPDQDDEHWKGHIQLRRSSEDDYEITYQPV